MPNSNAIQDWSADRDATVATYSSAIEDAVAAQRAFVHSSLTSEARYSQDPTQATIGPGLTYNLISGLHVEHDASAVARWVSIGAPIDGLWNIHYGDDAEHWETPLLTALVDERIAVAEAILAQGAKVDAPNFYNDENKITLGHTALHMMVARGEGVHVRRLIAAGADVNRRNTDGVTPISLAAADDDHEVVALLLDSNADPSLVDFFGRSALDRSGPRTRTLLAGIASL